jgi:hypothetical protein
MKFITFKIIERIKIGLGIALLASLAGCAAGYVGVNGGYAGVDGGYGGTVVVPVADPYFGGGIYERGGDVRGYSHRGSASRVAAHGAGGGARGGKR